MQERGDGDGDGDHWGLAMDEALIREASAGLGWARRAARILTPLAGRRITWQQCEDRAKELGITPSVAPPAAAIAAEGAAWAARQVDASFAPLPSGFEEMDDHVLFTIRLPLPPKALSPNSRADRRGKDGKAAYIKAYRDEACLIAKNIMQLSGVDPPRWAVASVLVVCRFETERRRWDADNVAAAGKPALDGLADAGLLANDRYVVDYAGRSLVDPDNVGMAIYVWNTVRHFVQPPVTKPTPLRAVRDSFQMNIVSLVPHGATASAWGAVTVALLRACPWWDGFLPGLPI